LCVYSAQHPPSSTLQQNKDEADGGVGKTKKTPTFVASSKIK